MKMSHALGGAAFLALSAATLPALAHTQMYATTLSGANENPPNASLGGGAAVVTLDLGA
jgi:hypothetical protein